MPGLVPGIHVFGASEKQDVDGRDKPGHDGDGALRMSTDTDAKLIEQARKLFAGDWQFFWASPSIETLPPMAGMEVAFAGRSNVGK